MKNIHYTFRRDEEWFPVPTTKRGSLACCDCGLVHSIVARVTKTGRVYLAAVRDDKETARVRRLYREKLSHFSKSQ